jgi:hypothetical protein
MRERLEGEEGLEIANDTGAESNLILMGDLEQQL